MIGSLKNLKIRNNCLSKEYLIRVNTSFHGAILNILKLTHTFLFHFLLVSYVA